MEGSNHLLLLLIFTKFVTTLAIKVKFAAIKGFIIFEISISFTLFRFNHDWRFDWVVLLGEFGTFPVTFELLLLHGVLVILSAQNTFLRQSTLLLSTNLQALFHLFWLVGLFYILLSVLYLHLLKYLGLACEFHHASGRARLWALGFLQAKLLEGSVDSGALYFAIGLVWLQRLLDLRCARDLKLAKLLERITKPLLVALALVIMLLVLL